MNIFPFLASGAEAVGAPATSLYFHCSRVAPVEFAISYWILCFSPARALSLAFHSVSNSALAFAGSGVATERLEPEPSLDVLRGGVWDAFGCGLAWTLTFRLG